MSSLLKGRGRRALLLAIAITAAAAVAIPLAPLQGGGRVKGFAEQACSLPPKGLVLTQRGHFPARSGDIAILPKTPAYMTDSGRGWPHSGPWPYLVDVPLVFYGPGIVPPVGGVDRPVDLADVAPTVAALLGRSIRPVDGEPLREIVRESTATASNLKMILTVVWDGGGWNVLDQWPDAWPNLRRLMEKSVSYTNADVGSSPSVTPAIHTTLGTGVYPWKHGVPLIRVRDDAGDIVDSFREGESSSDIRVPTLAERWDQRNGNRALVGMVGYEPWHLGMIGKGAERPGGDKDHAVWLDQEINEWITNPDHYSLPSNFEEQEELNGLVYRLDAADGEIDGAWGEHEILDDRSRIEETPAFARYHGRELMDLIRTQGYGKDRITDLLFTNFKHPDRVGHYFNMASEEVREVVSAVDDVLGDLVAFLDRRFDPGEYLLIVTADHGQQPDDEAVNGYAIDPAELRDDIDAKFGPVTLASSSTEIFLNRAALARTGTTVDEVARFIGGYRLRDNAAWLDRYSGSGGFDPDDLLFDMAVPSEMLADLPCRIAYANP
jgi:arylsulfatase A-like enzyme